MKSLISLLSGLAITALALTYALWDINFQTLSNLLYEANYWFLIPFLSLLTLYFWAKALRWAVILRPLGRFTTTQVTPAMMIGFGGNNILPAHLGEVLRTVVFARQFRKPYSGVFTSLIMERMLDIVAILGLYFVAVLLIGESSEALRIAAWAALCAVAVACFGIFLSLWKPDALLSLWRRCSEWLPYHLQERGERMLRNIVLALSAVRSPGALLLQLGYSVLQWGLMAAEVWIAMWALGDPISASVALITLAVITLAVTVPSAPGYVGSIQAAFVFALVPFGVTQEAALAGSVFFLVAQWIPVTTIGALFFFFTGLGTSEVRRDVEGMKHAVEINYGSSEK